MVAESLNRRLGASVFGRTGRGRPNRGVQLDGFEYGSIEGGLPAGDGDYFRVTMRSAGTFIASDGHIELPTEPGLEFDLIESEEGKTKDFRQALDNLAIVVEDL